jgi:ABC-type antimicrobial peptide transport system permease subunit
MPGVKKTIADFSPALVMDFDLLDRQLASSVNREKLMATLAGFFGVLAAILATIGLYGVISYSVARRTHEIGIRMALGADARRVSRMIVGEAARLLGMGLAAGVVLALIGGRAAAAMLYGLAPHDPVTFGVAVLLMAGIAFFASYLPARRAARVHPMSALRED